MCYALFNPIQIHREKNALTGVAFENANLSKDHSQVAELMPTASTLAGITSLAEAFRGLHSRRVQVSRLAIIFRNERTFDFLSTLKAAEMLSLLERTNEYISLTDLGIGFLLASEGKMRIIRARLSGIEPFKTTLELLSKRKYIFVSDIIESLSAKYPSLKFLSGVSEEEKIRNMLIEWGTCSELMVYDGKTRGFQLT